MIRVAIESAARADVQAAMDHYGAITPELATRFATELDVAIDRIAALPHAMAPAGPGLRRCTLRRFPYSVIYRTAFEPLRVLAVVHHRQNPERWKVRV